MDVLISPNDLLSSKSEQVKVPLTPEDSSLMDDMFRYVKEHEGEAVGLSAVQVGSAKRMCAIRFRDGLGKLVSYKLANPRIVWHSGESSVGEEGCLSVPGPHSNVRRWSSVKVMAYDAMQGRNVVINASGFLSRVLQHEIDHMDGILISDKTKENK